MLRMAHRASNTGTADPGLAEGDIERLSDDHGRP